EEGGLVAYGPRFTQIIRDLYARQLVQLFRGVKVADIPVEQPTKFELAINLKTATALGITVPAGIVARADNLSSDGKLPCSFSSELLKVMPGHSRSNSLDHGKEVGHGPGDEGQKSDRHRRQRRHRQGDYPRARPRRRRCRDLRAA